MKRLSTLYLLAALTSLTASASPFGTLSHSLLWESRRAEFFAGPATACFRFPTSLTTLEVTGSLQEGSGDYAAQLGTDPKSIGFEASTYTLQSSHTLTGRALYSIGHTAGVTLNENADPLTVYPYLTADSIGGAMTAERYLFEGGYADRGRRIFWGVTGGYEAGLSYRSVDPRPKSTTGRLTVNGGIGLTAGPYGVSLSASYRRYTQTSELMFKDDTGGDKTYQMTGLGTVYNRFTGLGLKSNFRGNTFGVTAELVPTSDAGFVAAGSYTRFNLSKLLTDLNSLPLARAWENRFNLKAGYISGAGELRWMADGELTAVRRHGIENIFGDATLSSYPQIDALEMYADNRLTLRAGGTLDWRLRRNQTLAIRLYGVHARRSETYAYPRLESHTSETSLHLTLQYAAAFGERWLMSVTPWGIFDYNASGGLALTAACRVSRVLTVGINAGAGIDHPRLSDFDSPKLVSGRALCADVGLFVKF